MNGMGSTVGFVVGALFALLGMWTGATGRPLHGALVVLLGLGFITYAAFWRRKEVARRH